MADKSPRAQSEEKILQFWKENKIFEKSLKKEAPKGEFVFYEGPPTANGRPGIHHIEARAFKDAIPRYKTMQGYHVPRKGGWDTHGLPVELEVEKQLGLKSKKEIEQYGIAKFNEECRKSVWKYVDEWGQFTDRMGYWVDGNNPYVTYHNSYIEALWGVLSHVEKRNLLYKDYKVLPWCPRCGTALSSHELAQGYQDVKDISLYVKFKVKGKENTYLVAWTTTPWTLPGNVALAVGRDIEYVKYTWKGEFYIVAKERAHKWPGLDPEEFVGKDLVGLEYESLYEFSPRNENSHKVYAADFVNTEDGTGIVHTAVMYGQDDFELGTKVGLPKHHLVDETGHFKTETDWLAGKSVVEESTTVEILKDLQNRGLLFDKESHTHSYPFCWRCKTRLIYYARDSWYIRMSQLRDELVAENKKINWEPAHIREGRFGEWLREVKDWAISRERYWGTPLPIWENVDDSKRIVVDSLDALKKHAKNNGNKFIFVRHGEAESNAQNICNSDPTKTYHLTETGKKEAIATAKKIKKADAIYASPYMRTLETAEIIANELGFDKVNIQKSDKLGELDFGEFDGKPFGDYLEYDKKYLTSYDVKLPGGESYLDAKKRFGQFLYEIDQKHSRETLVVVTHGMGLEAIAAVIEGADLNRSKKIIDTYEPKVGEVLEFDFIPLPHNADFELDLHRPYIDEVVLEKDGEEYRRVKEVMDVWFDSGAMPFAQSAGWRTGNLQYPADFISEAIDQTRGWFYTLHAVGVLMGKGHAYKNVICLGHILDKEGKKMSKSIGNVINPWEMIDKYGVDTLRLWMYSVNQPGESKNFDERSVDEIQKRVFNLLDNVYSFYELYRNKELEGEMLNSQNVLDIWILARLSGLIDAISHDLDEYKILEPVRGLRDFIDDLSTWYLRRSRDRIKEGDKDAKRTLYFVLKELSKLMAPFAPFAAEDLYLKLRRKDEPESVHLSQWPQKKVGKFESMFSMFSSKRPSSVIEDMNEARRIVTAALEARSKANIKVRQPLSVLEIKKPLGDEYLEIIKDELNVKMVAVNPALETEVSLITILTPELIEEGKMRDAIRAVQEWRKESNLKPGEKASYPVPEDQKELFAKYSADIKKVTNVEF